MNGKKTLIFVAVALLIMICDAGLKAYVYQTIPLINIASPVFPFGGIDVFRNWHGIDFSIVHVHNKGAAWGIFASLQEYLLYARIAIIGGLISYLFFAKTSSFRKFSLTLVVAGACSNVLDYFVYGYVVDMFYFILWGYSYPVFNIADSAIFLGIVLLLAEGLVNRWRFRPQPSKKPS
jgi:signal peptidase II